MQRLVIAVLAIEVVISLAEIGFVIVAVWLTNIDTSHISVSDIANFAGDVVQTVLLGVGLVPARPPRLAHRAAADPDAACSSR